MDSAAENNVVKKNKRYLVIDKQTNQEVEGAFILRPEIDHAARMALAAYAASTKDSNTKVYIEKRLKEITRELAEKKLNKAEEVDK